jgi:hypothetical protein
MPKCSSTVQSLPVGTGASAPKDSTSFTSQYIFSTFVSLRGRVLLIGLVFVIDVMVLLLLLLLLSKWALSCWALQDYQLDHKRLFLLWYVLRHVGLWLLQLWHISWCQITNGWTTSALACCAASTSYLSFRKRRVWDNKILKNLRK